MTHGRRIAVIAGVLLLLPVVVGAILWRSSQPPPRRVYEGTVSTRRFEPSHTYTYWVNQYAGTTCTRSGSGTTAYTSCTPHYILVPMQGVQPDRWWITVVGCPRRLKEAPADYCTKQRARRVQVGESTYDALKVGAHWSAT